MDEDRNQEPGERMRNIFSSSDDETNAQFQPIFEPEPEPSFQPEPQSVFDKLPKLKMPVQASPQVEPDDVSSTSDTSGSSSPLNVLPRDEKAAQDEPHPSHESDAQAQADDTPAERRLSHSERFLRALWTTASVFSMFLNIVLIIALVVLYWAYRDIKLPEGVDISMLNNLLSGLYSNFEKMDRATIETVIPVDAQIPLDITVPVQTTTQILLSETVVIPNAQVVINTGGLNINSNARVTLPAGTPLLVNLNFNLPVRDTIPVHLDVPVSIPMADTELHEPFVGLQEVVKPIYCFVEPGASNLDGQVICQ